MDLKIAARMIAVLVIGAGLTVTAVALRQKQGSEETPVFRSLDPGGDLEVHVSGAPYSWNMRTLDGL